MAFPLHTLLTFGGTFVDQTDEEWSSGIRFTSTADAQNSAHPSAAGLTLFTNTAVTELSAWFSDTATGVSNDALLTWVKVNTIGPDGRYAAAPRPQVDVSNVAGGVTGGLRYPHQVSLAVTFETDTPRGLASKGRIYLPAPGLPIGGTGLIDTNLTQSVATRTGALLTALNLEGNPGFYAAVVSQGGQSGEGVARRIRRVSVDNRFDIQRRRGESIGGRDRVYSTVGN